MAMGTESEKKEKKNRSRKRRGTTPRGFFPRSFLSPSRCPPGEAFYSFVKRILIFDRAICSP